MIGLVGLVLSMTTMTAAADDGGEIGYFGGVSDGRNLPYTIDAYVDSGIKPETQFDYREVVFLSGTPVVCRGTITVTKDDVDFAAEPVGTYTERYTVSASDADTETTINRNITFVTSYRVLDGVFKRQIIRTSILSRWTESITVGGVAYTLLPDESTFSKASVEDVTAGVSYFDTEISYHARYSADGTNTVDMLVNGDSYGYQQPWSKLETQDLTIQISNDGGETYSTVVDIKPVLEAKKTIYYDQTSPYPISFGGTYNQRLERQGTLTYAIETGSATLTDDQMTGEALISPANEVEKLVIPENLEFIEGHWAQEDLKKLYSMEIFTETPHNGMQIEAMSRGAFVKALSLAMRIDTSAYEATTRTKRVMPQIFGDVPSTHPYYKYVMGAYDTKLVNGIGEDFDVDVPITRQEAFTIYVRVIGLERLGVTDAPKTPFIDDAKIAEWARKEIMAGYNLGIIKGDASGKVNPTTWISKAEGAAIINRLIDYLREEIATDYKH